MNSILKIVVVAVVAGACGDVLAQAPADSPQKDRVVYDRLIRELRGGQQRLSTLYSQAIGQARAGGGAASTPTRAEILALREEMERKSVRLMLVAGRHGWPVPEFPVKYGQSGAAPAEPSPRELMFPADPVISEALAEQARRLAGRIRLPVISITAAGKRR